MPAISPTPSSASPPLSKADAQRLEELETIYAHAPVGLCVIDREYRWVRINRCLAEMNGYPVQVHIGRTVRELLPAVADEAERLLNEVIATGKPMLNVEVVGETPARPGVRRVWLEHFYPLHDETGRVAAVNIVCEEVTEKRYAQRTLMQSEERYRTFIQQSSEGIWRFELETPVPIDMPEEEIIDAAYTHGYLAECNDAMARMYGYGKAQDIVGARLGDLLPRHDPHNIDYLRAFIRHEFRLNNAESHEVDKDGQPKFFLNNLFGVIENGMLVRGWGMQRDITGFKYAEVALRDSEERFRATFDNAAVGIAHVSLEGRWLRLNDRFCEIVGYTQQELLTRTFADITHPDDLEADWALAKKLIAKEISSYRMEKRYIHKNGTQVAVNLTVSLVVTPEGSPNYFIAVVEDITERKKIEAALRDSEAKFRTLADNIPQLAWMADETGNIFWYNQRWYDYTGTSPEQMEGWGWQKIHHPDHRASVMEKFRQALAREEDWEDTFPLRGKDGQYRWFLSRAKPIRDEKGKVVRWFGTNTDITEQREAETQVLAAKEQAEAASQAKSQFLANMSHEIRTPMNAVVGLANILSLSDRLDDKHREWVDTLKLSAQSLMALIDDLLDISKIETNKIDLEYIPFSFAEIVSEVFGVLALKAREKGLALYFQPSPVDHVRYLGDPLRIRQILMNLVSNAVKFTESGSVTVHLSTYPHAEPGMQYVHISVRDTGVGIPAHKQELIFDIFTQADSSTTRRYGGTGLGLAISKNLAEIMEGGISVKSEEGKGSEFILHLPLETVQADAAADTREAAGSALPQEKARKHRNTVLLVEDYLPNVLVARLLLENFGWECEVAHNGAEALERIEARRGAYSLVLMDVQMPGMDGLEATRTIRRQEKQRNLTRLPVVAMTAHALSGDRERCLSAGMDDYISKPFEPDALERVLKKFAAVPAC